MEVSSLGLFLGLPASDCGERVCVWVCVDV